jgi:hypothetical protein
VDTLGIMSTMYRHHCIVFKHLLLVVFFFSAFSVHAYTPVMVGERTARDVTEITAVETEKMFFGELKGFPHMFLIQSGEPFTLKAELLLPDIQDTPRDINVIIIRNTGFQGRIQEVTRMHAKDAGWDSFYDPWGGDRYLRGITYESEMESGVYRIEVSAPDNDGKYVLVVGSEESFGPTTYFKTLGQLSSVKSFFEKSPIRVLEAPPVFIPLIVIIFGIVFWRLRLRKTSRP